MGARNWVGLVAVVMLLPVRVEAGGFEIPDNGTRAMGRGGAYAAAVAEPSAIYYNPAALALIDGVAVTLDANLWFYNLDYQRAPFTNEPISGLEVTYPFAEVENETPFFPAPMLFASYDFGLADWGFGLGLYGPSSIGRRRFPAPNLEALADISVRDESERGWGHGYLAEQTNILLIYYSLAAAYDFGPVQLGLTFQLAMLDTEFTQAVDGGGVFDPGENADEAPSLYARTRLAVLGVAPTGIIGVRYQPISSLTLSLSYRPRIKFDVDGDLEVTFPTTIVDQVRLTDETARLEITLPDVVRFGARWAFLAGGREVADVELDVVYEAWSQTEGFRVTPAGGLEVGFLNQVRDIPVIFIPKGYDDTLSFRLGGDVRLTEDVHLRAGAFIEGSADGDFFKQGSASPGFANIDFTPFHRTGLSVGASYRVGDFSFDLALMHVFSPGVEESDGEVDIVFPLWVCNDPQTQTDRDSCEARTTSPLHAVNNGQYNATYDLISVGVTYHHQ